MATQAKPETWTCPDCAQVFSGSAEGLKKIERYHWQDCASEKAMQRRIRSGKEPSYVPMTFSRLTMWQKCSFREYRENRDPERVRLDSYAADKGTVIHALLEARTRGETPELFDLLSMMDLTEMEDVRSLVKSADTIVLSETREHVDFLESDMRMHWEFVVPATAKKYRDAGTEYVIVQVEVKPDLVRLFMGEFAHIRGVVDYKTGRLLDSEVKLQNDVQAKLTCAVLSENPLGREATVFEFAQPQLRKDPTKPPRATWTRAEIDAFKEDFKVQAEMYVNDEENEPRAGSHCYHCPFALDCPKGMKLIKDQETTILKAPQQILSMDDARAYAEYALALDRAKALADERIKEWLYATGEERVPVGDGHYGQMHGLSKSLNIQDPEVRQQVIDILADTPYQWTDYVRWDMKDGDGWKFIKGKRGPEAGLLASVAQDTPWTKWGFKKNE